MAYRIDYGPPMPSRETKREQPHLRLPLTAMFALLFVALTAAFWPEGREVLRRLLIPGDPEVTLEAAEAFARELGRGECAREAAITFCRMILGHEA